VRTSHAFAMPGPYPISFKSALSESDVVDLLRQSLGDWDPRERAQLPDICRIEVIRDGAHVNEIAFSITTARIESRGPQEVLERLDTLFAHACQRLTELEA
jgi:hypothetical protein